MTGLQPSDKATVETITGLHWWNERLLTFTTTKPEKYSFIAGQYARLGLPDEHGMVWRAYSMTSAPDANHLEFYGILVPNGLFTSRLKELRVGDRILLEKQVYGFMTPDRFSDGEDLWMLSTGTGIGPFVSMLRDTYVWRKFRNLILVHGVRHADEFCYRDVLLELRQAPPVAEPSAALIPVEAVSRDPVPEGETGRLYGRITTLLENGALEAHVGLPLSVESSRIMMCGNPEMIEDMRKILHARGMRPVRRALPGQFVTENYW